MPDRILLIEDDAHLGEQIVSHLEEAGFETTWRTHGNPPLPALRDFSVLILDLMLPGTYGLDVLKTVRAESELPVIVLSARNDTADKVRALKLGADDYVTKPFWPGELIARVVARLRRPSLSRGEIFEHGGVRVELEARVVTVDGRRVELTRVEFDLLAALVRRPGAAVSRAWLTEHVLDPDRSGTERTLDVHVSRLRKKLGAPERIATVWGIGYRFDLGGAE